ncbi:unnamed protein product, partial [Laminaria digitata]
GDTHLHARRRLQLAHRKDLLRGCRLHTLARISKDLSPMADFKARGVTKAELPGRYPYRDDGLKYWEATHTWVTDYLKVMLR